MSRVEKSSSELLTALAIATTVYHEASPDMIEEARLQYSIALEQFRAAQSSSSVSSIESAEVAGSRAEYSSRP